MACNAIGIAMTSGFQLPEMLSVFQVSSQCQVSGQKSLGLSFEGVL